MFSEVVFYSFNVYLMQNKRIFLLSWSIYDRWMGWFLALRTAMQTGLQGKRIELNPLILVFAFWFCFKSPKMSLLFGFVLNFSFFFKQKSEYHVDTFSESKHFPKHFGFNYLDFFTIIVNYLYVKRLHMLWSLGLFR